jgi:hypothetical protein
MMTTIRAQEIENNFAGMLGGVVLFQELGWWFCLFA